MEECRLHDCCAGGTRRSHAALAAQRFKNRISTDNARTPFKNTSTTGVALQIVEENNYYPFGLKHKGYNNVVTSTNQAQKYTFNGQPFDESLSLNVQEMTFRHYDPAIGRFFGMDRLAELMPSLTPYRFAYNNPVLWADPTGLIEESVVIDMFNRSGSGRTTWTNDGYSGFETNDGGFVGYTSSDTSWNRSPGDVTNLPAVTVTIGNESSYNRAANQIEQNIYKTKWHNDFNQNERTQFGEILNGSNTFYGAVTDHVTTFSTAYLSTKFNSLKRNAAYSISKLTDLKAGDLYQRGQKLARKGSKFAKRMGPVGNILSSATIAYEVTTNTWDAHTIIDGGMLVTGAVATVFKASNPVGWAILGTIAVYGVLDATLDINGKIDNELGRNSGFWD